MINMKSVAKAVALASVVLINTSALAQDSSLTIRNDNANNAYTKQYSPFDILNFTGEESRIKLIDPRLTELSGTEQSYDIAYTKWQPYFSNGQTIVYNHGFQSHKDWFSGTAQYLAILGYTVYAFDRVGSGESSGGISFVENDQGELDRYVLEGHVYDWQTWTWTLDEMVKLAESEHPNNTLTVWGNSFGAQVVTAFMNQYAPQSVDKVVFTTPGLFANLPLPFTLDEFIAAKPYDYFASTIPDTDGDQGAAYFTADPFYQWAIRHDLRSLREVTQSFYFAIVGIGGYNRDRSDMNSDPLVQYPRFYLLATNDTMMDNVKTLTYINKAPANATAKFYSADDNRHFLSFSSDMQEAVMDIHYFIQGEEVVGKEPLGSASE
ncbi:alpha/beta hydrolase [Pseudoalteromonas sp. T1lg65]|uniref:alpha/beta hydrolase n=1 Tax=Pseudoalteromonas sp. T1lg65 TaxID=2077101 RepID=UPI003F7AEA07